MSMTAWYHQYRSARQQQQQQPATAPSGATVIDMSTQEKDKKHPDSLFGPNIGVVSSGPAWTNVSDKKVLSDELTQDIVRGWIEKSKEASEPTTTLQALVNLKRPTIRLSPLAEESVEPGHHHHGLEFEYDCDAPKCGIYVHVLLPSDHPDAPVTASATGLAKLLVFETVVTGGFGKVLKLEEGAMLELGRFEDDGLLASPDLPAAPPKGIAPEGGASSDSVHTSEPTTSSRRRFTKLNFRKRTHNHNHSVAGPALAVLDAEPTPANPVADKEGKKDDEGVRVTIRLAALDEQGTELASPNEQVTYLHVVRFGIKPTASTAEEQVEDTRPWVVKVVKREATIGPHTFHLHEIYGLASSSSATHAPVAPLPSAHSYPPETAPPEAAVTEDEPSSECLLCLSSAREVVLLPCRHLVACKDCALNMVEFGAGGQITQAEEPVHVEEPTENQGEGETNDAETPPSTAAAAPAPVLPAPTRRKRKAKGWFCPVCRQPYTSLLRITTTPPEVTKGEELGQEVQVPPAAATAGGGLLSGGFRPTFLRGFSARNQQNDIEAQRVVPAAA